MARAHALVRAAAALACTLLLPVTASAAPAIGSVAPDFALKDLEGRNQRLSEFRGDAVVLTFWGSWCGPCRGALQSMIEATAGDSGALVAIGVSLDRDQARAASVSRALGVQFPSLVDSGQAVGRLYDVQQLPYTLLIDREGVVRASWSREPVPPDVLLQTLGEIQP